MPPPALIKCRVNDTSMRPLFREGMLLLVEHLPPAETVAIGDIVVMQADNQTLVVHRLIRHTSGAFITKGDNRLEPDHPWQAAQLWGRVRSAEVRPGKWRAPRPVIARLLALASRLRLRKFTRVVQFLLCPWAWMPDTTRALAQELHGSEHGGSRQPLGSPTNRG